MKAWTEPEGRSWTGYSPRKLHQAGIAVSRDFWVRDAVTNECRLMTDSEWDAEMSGLPAEPEGPQDEPELTEEEIAAERAEFEAFARRRNVSPEVFALMCPWAASRTTTPPTPEAK